MKTFPQDKIQHILEYMADIFYHTILNESEEKILENVLKYAMELTESDAGSILLYDPQKDDLYFRLSLGENNQDEKFASFRIPRGQGLCWQAINEKRVINVLEVHDHPNYLAYIEELSGYPIHSMLVAPLEFQGKLNGAIELINKKNENSVFSEIDINIASFFAAYASIALVMFSYKEESLQKERLAAIGMASAGIAHYIKNVVTGLDGASQMLDQSLEEGNLEGAQASWNILKRNIRKISNFSLSLLRYSSDKKPDFRFLDLNKLLQDLCEDFIKEYQTSVQFDIKLSLDHNLKTFSFAGDQLTDVFYNLFINSIQAYDQLDQHMILRVSTHYDAEKNLVIIEYEDNGPGISEEGKKKVFNAFFSTKKSGTGLGLFAVKKAIEDHDGQIWVEDAKSFDTGACFHMAIPIQNRKIKSYE